VQRKPSGSILYVGRDTNGRLTEVAVIGAVEDDQVLVINPADYVIGPDVTVEDADLDEMEIYYQGERLSEARAAELGEQAARQAREGRTG
jgi:hypothetical protein